jgi:hypothetical protein
VEIIIDNGVKSAGYKTMGNPELKKDMVIFKNLILQFENHYSARKFYKYILFYNLKNLSIKGITRIHKKTQLH